MKGYCKSCEKKVFGVKKPFSHVIFWVLGGWAWGYLFYHWVKPKNKCPVCGMPVSLRKPKE